MKLDTASILDAKKKASTSNSNKRKQNIVVEVDCVTEINGVQYIQGTRKIPEIWGGASKSEKVLVSIPEETHEIKTIDFNELMSPRYKNRVEEGGVLLFERAEMSGKKQIDDQEFQTYHAEYYHTMQHRSNRDNAIFMKNFANAEPGESITVEVQGLGYQSFWSQKVTENGKTKYVPRSKVVSFRPEDAEMRSVATVEDVKAFIQESFHNYKPSPVQGQEVRRLRWIESEDKAHDIKVEIKSRYSPEAFQDAKGNVIGGYAMPDDYLDAEIDKILSSNRGALLNLLLNAAQEQNAKFDLELIPGKEFYRGPKTVADMNIFTSDGKIAPPSEEGKLSPYMVLSNQYLMRETRFDTDGEKVEDVHLAIAPMTMALSIGKADEGNQLLFVNQAAKNCGEGYKIPVDKLETRNFSPVRENAKKTTATTGNVEQKAPQKPANTQNKAPVKQEAKETKVVNEKAPEEPKFSEADGPDFDDLDAAFHQMGMGG